MFSDIIQAIVSFFRPNPPPLPVATIPDVYANRDLNRKAFLAMIRYSEGTAQIPDSDNGYRALVGGGTFTSYAQHPHPHVWIAKIKDYSSAAGAYQILYREWMPYTIRLGLKDFGPQYQDAWALNAIREVNALDDVDSGRFLRAVMKCKSRWASLPDAVQAIRSISELKDVYSNAGGQFSA